MSEQYLLRKIGKARVAHIWNVSVKDTVCRMASTGGLAVQHYTLADRPCGLPVCQHCKTVKARNEVNGRSA